MKKIIVAIPASHTFFWTQTCISSLLRFPPVAEGFETQIVVVDNSHLWSPAIRGLTETRLGNGVTVLNNYKSNQFHASALDCVVESMDFDFLMALETDVCALRPTWLQWFVDQIGEKAFAVGHWHHESFVNPSCTLYRGSVLRKMNAWCKENKEPILRWGPAYNDALSMDGSIDWIAGPFAEKRGWPAGTQMAEHPSGRDKGPGWYEPGQMLYHWAKREGLPHVVCQTATTTVPPDAMPTQTFYGMADPLEKTLELDEMTGLAETVHMWGGTRALDILKHPVECGFVKKHTPFWLEREARFWLKGVDADVREKTVELIKTHGWHARSLGGAGGVERDAEAARYVSAIYRGAGIPI